MGQFKQDNAHDSAGTGHRIDRRNKLGHVNRLQYLWMKLYLIFNQLNSETTGHPVELRNVPILQSVPSKTTSLFQ